MLVYGSTTVLSLIVDDSFMPTPASLQAALDDVRLPWAPTPSVISGSFVAPKPVKRPVKKPVPKRKKRPVLRPPVPKTFTLQTPLDGTLDVAALRGPAGMRVSIVDARTGKLLAPPGVGASIAICGSRTVKIVVDAPRAGAFRLAVSAS
jgi:hypothetical protein